eukprot:scaffold604_cov384-Prasinococcus_capsulatus_cf.AAC.20
MHLAAWRCPRLHQSPVHCVATEGLRPTAREKPTGNFHGKLHVMASSAPNACSTCRARGASSFEIYPSPVPGPTSPNAWDFAA